MTENYSNVSVSSSSSLNSSFQDTEDDHTIARILAEEENLKFENKLGKRLSHLDSIPHTPRVNGEIPNVNDATLDHARLSERLVTYGLAELQMEGDGNCQFRALADQLFRNPEYHKHVRKAVIKQLKKFRKLYEGYVPMKYKSYLKKMKKSGEWGDHVTLQAAADRFGAKICLVTSFRDTCYIEILPKDNNPNKGLHTLTIILEARNKHHRPHKLILSRERRAIIFTPLSNFGSAFGVKCITTRCMLVEIFLRERQEESIGFSRVMKRYHQTHFTF